ncbi:MAG: hypothetical protein AABZ15_07015 [Nitrospirota bacterium]
MAVPDGNWTGCGMGRNGPPLVAVVLRSVVETNVGTADGAVGAYCRSSSVDGVRQAVVISETVLDDTITGPPEPGTNWTVAVLLMTVPEGVAAHPAEANNRIKMNENDRACNKVVRWIVCPRSQGGGVYIPAKKRSTAQSRARMPGPLRRVAAALWE